MQNIKTYPPIATDKYPPSTWVHIYPAKKEPKTMPVKNNRACSRAHKQKIPCDDTRNNFNHFTFDPVVPSHLRTDCQHGDADISPICKIISISKPAIGGLKRL